MATIQGTPLTPYQIKYRELEKKYDTIMLAGVVWAFDREGGASWSGGGCEGGFSATKKFLGHDNTDEWYIKEIIDDHPVSLKDQFTDKPEEGDIVGFIFSPNTDCLAFYNFEDFEKFLAITPDKDLAALDLIRLAIGITELDQVCLGAKELESLDRVIKACKSVERIYITFCQKFTHAASIRSSLRYGMRFLARGWHAEWNLEKKKGIPEKHCDRWVIPTFFTLDRDKLFDRIYAEVVDEQSDDDGMFLD